MQRNQFVHALNIAADVPQSRRVTDTIASVRQHLKRRRDSVVPEWESAKSIAVVLRNEAQSRLTAVATELKHETSDVLDQGTYFASGAEASDDRSHFYRYQIIQTAKELDYSANPLMYRSWARLVLRNTTETEILISIHGIGQEFQGVLAWSASWFQRVETEDGEREVGPVTPVTDRVFLINYKEPLDEAAERFSDWLEDAVVRGLKLWQETAL